MAYNETKTSYDVQPVDNPDGTLGGLRIIQQQRSVRYSESGAELDRGWPKDVAEIEVPWTKVADLARDLVDWSLYYASGNAARDRHEPVRWPNSLQTWTERDV